MSDYGTSEWLSPQQLSGMVTTVARLRALAISLAANGGNTIVSQGLSNWLNALDASRARVESGMKSLQSWISDAAQLEASIDDEFRVANESIVSRFWSEVVVQSAADTRDAAVNAADDAKDALKFGVPLIAIIVIGLVLLKAGV